MIPRIRSLFALLIVSSATQPASAGGCEDWRVGPLLVNGANGASSSVHALTSWDPDGNGPQPTLLVAGGAFGSIQGITLNKIGAWDAYGTWQALGGGSTSGNINDVEVVNGELFAAGNFSTIGGSAANSIARWGGLSWQPLSTGIVGWEVKTMIGFGGGLIAAGDFDFAGGVPVISIARWNGSTWQAFDAGLVTADVKTMVIYNGELYAGGSFTFPGGVTDHIARWNGSSWQPINSGIDSWVWCLAVYNGELVAGGFFNNAGGIAVNNIARWNGTIWRTLGTAPNDGLGPATGYPLALLDHGGLIATGQFDTAGGQTAWYIARWNGTTWQPMSGGIGGPFVFALASHRGEVVAGGSFGFAGVQTANNLARWDGSQWYPYGGSTVGGVLAMTTFNGRAVTGGLFHQTGAVGQPARNIVGYDGVVMSALGSGMNDAVNALKEHTPAGWPFHRELVAGGWFTTAGGVACNRIARWREELTPNPPAPSWQPMGQGFTNAVFGIEKFNGDIFAAGAFTLAEGAVANRIARWNEAGGTWQSFGTGANGTIFALKEFNGLLYAGGAFTTINGVITGGLAVYNGSTWNMVGGVPFSGQVYSLEVHNGKLIIGGFHSHLPASPGLVQYSQPTGYTSIGTGGMQPASGATVRAIKSSNGNLYVGGFFDSAGGASAKNLAVWNGTTWAEVQGGTDNGVYALNSFHDEMYTGGYFTTVRNGAITSPGWARYLETGVPWIAYEPKSASVNCHGTFAPGVQVALGHGGLSLQWRRDGVPLNDGPTGTGSMIIGSTGNFALLKVNDADEGAYDCVVTSGCGSVTSLDAVLTVNGNPCLGCPADIAPIGVPGGNGLVNVQDLLAVIGAWGPCANPNNCAADIAPINGDDLVNVQDLLAVIGAWGACP